MAFSPNTQVDKIFAEFDRSDSPGCALAVMQAGRLVYARGYGIADLDHNIRITPKTVFHAASLAKQFTAMCILLLVERGSLCLNDGVRKHLNPRLLNNLPSGLGEQITVRDILSHTSGIRDQFVLLTMAGWRLSDDVITRDDVLDLVHRMNSLDFKPPRRDCLYSNTGYKLAGLIVESISGLSLSQFAHQNIFKPLRMKRTQFYESHGLVVQNRAYGYKKTNDQHFQLRMPNYDDLTGPTNLLTTVKDLARWDRNFERKTVGGDFALSLMRTPSTLLNGRNVSIPLAPGLKVDYGLGLMISRYRGLNTIEHNGRDAGYRSHLIRFPDQHFGVACLCNLALPNDVHLRNLVHRVADVYLADQLSPASPTSQTILSQEELGSRVGVYRNSATQSPVQISIAGGGLNISFEAIVGTLTAISRDRFRLLGPPQPADVIFTTSGDSAKSQLLLQVEGAQPLMFDAAPPKIPVNLTEYTGRYYSKEIDAVYNVTLDGDSLAIVRRKYPKAVLRHVDENLFTTNLSDILAFCAVTFLRDAQRHIIGFQIDGLNIHGFEFKKCR
jgi:CubicO group peptidase (beta-lactamase class C family)